METKRNKKQFKAILKIKTDNENLKKKQRSQYETDIKIKFILLQIKNAKRERNGRFDVKLYVRNAFVLLSTFRLLFVCMIVRLFVRLFVCFYPKKKCKL